MEPLLICAAVEASDFKFGTQHEFEFTLSETTFGTKIGGSEIGEYPKMWDLTFIHSFRPIKKIGNVLCRTLKIPRPYDGDAGVAMRYDTIVCI